MSLEMPENYDEGSAPECQGIDEAVKRFENVMFSRIYVQQRLGDRLKNSIRIGMAILFMLSVSLFMLSLTLSSQMSLLRESVVHMSKKFVVISENMEAINLYMKTMERQVSYMPKINSSTANMDRQIGLMNEKLAIVQQEIDGITGHVVQLQGEMTGVMGSVQQIDGQVNLLTHDTHRMSKPAKSFNKFFPF